MRLEVRPERKGTDTGCTRAPQEGSEDNFPSETVEIHLFGSPWDAIKKLASFLVQFLCGVLISMAFLEIRVSAIPRLNSFALEILNF